ncbi:MAG TPA: bifunctional aminotransferase class I/II-fold pyridoxal phosphate-dependent enzyme/GNAT family N-acetyltransferase, partial [Ktedonobacteraceae bacterium]|nr:bifunctional aminotransferase class I/II-fold pyridoxal phosphate-dependent enzyme/GNAT family N-acetyltransferase [Ktedonobacteraceae bacterium]
MERAAPQIGAHVELRAVEMADAPALHTLDYSFETDRIYTLHVHGHLAQGDGQTSAPDQPALAFELREMPMDLPIYKDLRAYQPTLEAVEARLASVHGGYVALADGQVAGVILLNVEEWRSVARIEDIIVGRQFRRYGIGSLLLNCAADWARNRGCGAILLETQNINYPAIQFYLRNGL